MASTKEDDKAVRFTSAVEKIEPESPPKDVEPAFGTANFLKPSGEAQDYIRRLSVAPLQANRMESNRMETFSYEPYSLPTSRANSPSRQSSSGARRAAGSSPRLTPSGTLQSPSDSPMHSPKVSGFHSPPLTPAGTVSKDEKSKVDNHSQKNDPAMITPQVSEPHEAPPTSIPSNDQQNKTVDASSSKTPPNQSPKVAPLPKTGSDVPAIAAIAAHPKHVPSFSVAPAGDSFPPSREQSPPASGAGTPAVTPGASTPVNNSGITTPNRAFTPTEEKDNPYSRSKRTNTGRSVDQIDPRFIFGSKEHRRSGHMSMTMPIPRSTGTSSSGEVKSPNEHKRLSGGFFSKRHDHAESEKKGGHADHHHHNSMSELKRFFRIGGHRHKEKGSETSSTSTKTKRSGTTTPPSSHGGPCVPFADDHGLENKYGKFGKVLGSGAGGSVRLMKRSTDGTTFAVKQFRARHSYETEKDYSKKVTAEFCIGSTLHHGNIIETMDLVHERGNYFVVMEYAPYDLFAIVMTGKMAREEVTCVFLQIMSGLSYLHNMGLAHRDLKLDNVVVNEQGIMKIIDFGSAAVFRYPFDNDITKASGIVGSDPYLAPEVYDTGKYDPQPTDVWSMAIIFCCMSLRRFPWKAPRSSDNSYRLFVAPPNDGPEHHLSDTEKPRPAPSSTPTSAPSTAAPSNAEKKDNDENKKPDSPSEKVGNSATPQQSHQSTISQISQISQTSERRVHNNKEQQAPHVIKGPWRLLRLLPRESRHIIGRMLEVDPTKRATMEEIVSDKWIEEAFVCRQEEDGKVIRAEGHTHTLEPGATPQEPPAGQHHHHNRK